MYVSVVTWMRQVTPESEFETFQENFDTFGKKFHLINIIVSGDFKINLFKHPLYLTGVLTILDKRMMTLGPLVL